MKWGVTGSPNPRPNIPKSLKPRFLLYKNAILSTIFCPCRLSKKNYTPPVLKVLKNPRVQMFYIECGRFAREDFLISSTQRQYNFFCEPRNFFTISGFHVLQDLASKIIDLCCRFLYQSTGRSSGCHIKCKICFVGIIFMAKSSHKLKNWKKQSFDGPFPSKLHLHAEISKRQQHSF